MPFIDVCTYPAVPPSQAMRIAQGITTAMGEIMGKRQDLTAVRIWGMEDTLWAIGSEIPAIPTAFVDVKVTAGTNTAEEKARLMEHLYSLLGDVLGSLAEASYVVIHELPAENWGYGGQTQAARRGKVL